PSDPTKPAHNDIGNGLIDATPYDPSTQTKGAVVREVDRALGLDPNFPIDHPASIFVLDYEDAHLDIRYATQDSVDDAIGILMRGIQAAHAEIARLGSSMKVSFWGIRLYLPDYYNAD